MAQELWCIVYFVYVRVHPPNSFMDNKFYHRHSITQVKAQTNSFVALRNSVANNEYA